MKSRQTKAPIKRERTLIWWLLLQMPIRRHIRNDAIRRIRARSKSAGISASQFTFLMPVFFVVLLVVAMLMVIVRRVARQDLLVFNIDALGHQLMEFTGLLRTGLESQVGRSTIVFYLHRGKSTRMNVFLFSIFKRLPAARGISFWPLPTLFWVPVAALAELVEETPWPLVRPMHPVFSFYNGLGAGEVLEVIKPGEKERFESYMDSHLPSWRAGYCVLGIRDSAYYGDPDNPRSSPPSIYVPGVNFLIDEGFAVVRMGRQVAEAFPVRHDRFLDYGFLGDSVDFLDVMLWAHCTFAVGDSTGLTDGVALLGGKTLVATQPMDPRSFISAPNYFFALEELVDQSTGKTLGLQEVIALMNQGWNLGSKNELSERGYVNAKPSALDILKAIQWFINELGEETSDSTLPSAQKEMMETLARLDLDAFPHYRKDAMSSHRWSEFKSKIYPGSLSHIL